MTFAVVPIFVYFYAMPSYYTYDEHYPSAINQQRPAPPFEWEDTRDWPKTYTYVAPNTGYQGYHPPAPVYQSSQPATPQYYYNRMVRYPHLNREL